MRSLYAITRFPFLLLMKITLAWVGKTKEPAIAALTSEYVKRIARYLPTESVEARDEKAVLERAAKDRATLVLLDARGKQMTSEELAAFVGKHQDSGTQRLMFAIGPADGWTDDARAKAAFTLSLGKMTLAHELARVVMLEQVYRAWTIIKGHPYHTGH
jgi:23S rRNA (pseudouridine1915-N3)-methyltransferase